MKRLFLVFSLVLAMALPAFAIDSTALFNPNIQGTNIQQGASVTPVGTVITWPSNQMPNDGAGVWLECNGQAIPTGAAYQELRNYLVSNNTPNYQNQFMRGGTAAQVGQTAADSIRGHEHGYIASNTEKSLSYVASVTGGAGGSGGEIWNCFVQVQEGCGHTYGGYSYVAVTDETGKDIRTGCMDVTLYPRCTSAGGVSGGSSSVESVMGSSIVSGALANKTTSSYGGAETAPQHIRVRYLIRALP